LTDDAGISVATESGPQKRQKLRSHITCPHCWHRFRSQDILWIARHEELRGDTVLGPDELLRFLPSRFNPAGEAIDPRGLACQWLACPNCHLGVPRVFLENEAMVFSLIGVPFSGKSYFLAAMTWGLRRVMPSKFCLSFTDADPGANQTLRDYEETLFLHAQSEQPVALSKTQMESDVTYTEIRLSGQPVRLPRPFLFTLRPTPDHPNAAAVEEFSRVLCLYDNAGEHFLPGADSTLAPGTQHLAKAHVLMFIFDPTQDPRFRERCQPISRDPQLFGQARTQLQSTILTESAIRVRQYAGLPPNRRLDRPLLVLVSKADIWVKLLGEELGADPFLDPAPQKPALVDVRRVAVVSQKIRRLLLDLTPEFVAAAEEFCQPVLYIPVSALGRSPETERDTSMLLIRPRDIRPSWVTAPVLAAFALWSHGLVGGNQAAGAK
jgi:hypothetical protein